jgi:subtilisin family serine protease
VVLATLTVILCLPPALAAGRPGLDPALARLLGPRGPGRQAEPGPEELRALSGLIVVDPDSAPPRVHVWMKLDGAGRQAVRSLGIRLESDRGDLASAFVPLPRLRALAAIPGVEWLRASRRYRPEIDVSVPAIGADAAASAYGVTGSGVIVGTIDSGADVTHGDFRNPDGTTRFLALWDQSGSGSPPACVPPPGFSYGCFYDRATINAFLGGSGTLSFANADGHGSHTLGIAAGDGSATGNGQPPFQFVGVAPGADLVSVKIFEEPGAPFCSVCNAGDALIFIDDQATAAGRPYVVNMSFGSHFGGHDGSDIDEFLVDTLTGPGMAGRAAVKSAGNDRGSRIHASAVVSTGTFVDRTFTIPSYTPAPGIFNDVQRFVVFHDAADRLTATLTSPSGFDLSATTGACFCAGGVNDLLPCTTDAQCPGGFCSGFQGIGTGDGVMILDNSCAPTIASSHYFDAEIDDQCSTTGCGGFVFPAPAPGTWRFRVTGASVAGSGRSDLWIVVSMFGATGFPVNWSTPDFTRLVSIPGTSLQITTVGGFFTKTEWLNVDGNTTFYNPPLPLGALADYSSPGPSRDGRLKPELAAPSDAIASALSADAAPDALVFDRLFVTRDARHWVLGGTSFAAPHAAGAYALALEVNPALDAAQLRTLATTSALADGFTGGALPDNDWGYGKLDVEAFLDNVVKPIDDLQALTSTTFTASSIPEATSYHVFRTSLGTLDGSDYGICLFPDLPSPQFTDSTTPPSGDGFGYTIAGEKDGIPGRIGQTSAGTWRPVPGCP